MKPITVFCLIVLFYCECECFDFITFMKELPNDIGNAIKSAFVKLINDIQQPVYLKKHSKKVKKIRNYSVLDKFNEVNYNGLDEKPATMPIFYEKLKIPVLPTPKWEYWERYLSPFLPKIIKYGTTKEVTVTTPVFEGTTKDEAQAAWEAEEENKFFGTLFFI